MFQFPEFAPNGLCIQPPATLSGCPVRPGCPIRRSPDQSAFDRSPELIAAYNVLHRLCTPRHPPCTLYSLTTFMNSCGLTMKLPASTMHLSQIKPDVAVGIPPTGGLRSSSRPKTGKLTTEKFACQVEPTGIEPATSALQTRRSPD